MMCILFVFGGQNDDEIIKRILISVIFFFPFYCCSDFCY